MDDEVEKNATIEELEAREATKIEFQNDPDIDKAVDQIVNEESDELLEAQDKAKEFIPPTEKQTFFGRIKSLVKAWWQNKRLRYITIFSALLLLIISIFVPFTRYGILNLAGVRVSSSMTVVDSGTGLPLKNITVQLQGQEQKSNEDGYVEFSGLKQGESLLKIDKRGYAKLDKIITLGWGSNPIGEQSLLATGSQYTFVLKDWLSGQPVLDGEATSGEDVAKSDDKGIIKLTIGEESEQAEATISATGFRTEKFILDDLVEGENIVSMVPSKKHVFVSNRSGEYDIYKIDIDGKNEEILLKSTGKEREIPFVLSHPNRDVVALVSSRDGNKNKDGFVLDGLFTVDAISGETYNITRSEQLQIIGWSGNKLLYVSVIEGVSAGNSQRSKLTSFDADTKERTDIASSNYFNDVKLINNKVYYAVSSYAVPRSQAKLYSSDIDGKNKKTLVDEQVWAIIRRDFKNLLFNTESQQWYTQEIDKDVAKFDGQPNVRASRNYTNSPDKSKSVWVDIRDGKGTLLLNKSGVEAEETIFAESGLTDPVYWVNESTLVYRITTNQETADYVLNLESIQKPKKIVNVLGNASRYFYQ